MSVRFDDGRIFLEGRCGAEDAETLLTLLLDHRDAGVDASAATRLHLAVVQLLGALAPAIVALPPDALLAKLLMSARDI